MERKLKAPPPVPTRFSLVSMVVRFVLTLATLVLIVYVSLCLVTRTEGFRYFLEDQVRSRSGRPLRFKAAYVSPRLELVVRGIEWPASGGSGRFVRIHEVRLQCSVRAALRQFSHPFSRMEIQGAAFEFVPAQGPAWEPQPLAPLAFWLDEICGLGLHRLFGDAVPASVPADQLGRALLFWNPRAHADATEIHIESARWVWRDWRGNVYAELGGADLHIIPVKLPARSMTYLDLSVNYVRPGDGEHVRNVRVELLAHGERRYWIGAEENPVDSRAPPDALDGD